MPRSFTVSLTANTALAESGTINATFTGEAAAAVAGLSLGFGDAPKPATAIVCPVTAFKHPP